MHITFLFVKTSCHFGLKPNIEEDKTRTRLRCKIMAASFLSRQNERSLQRLETVSKLKQHSDHHVGSCHGSCFAVRKTCTRNAAERATARTRMQKGQELRQSSPVPAVFQAIHRLEQVKPRHKFETYRKPVSNH